MNPPIPAPSPLESKRRHEGMVSRLRNRETPHHQDLWAEACSVRQNSPATRRTFASVTGLAQVARWALLAAFLAPVPLQPSLRAASLFRTNDVVAWVGGASVVATDHSGLLETALTLAHPGHRLRFRSIAWEGDTVFAQPRELNFPPATQVLRRVQATVVCTQFGSLEALEPELRTEAFAQAYRQLLAALRSVTPRLVLVVPPPFEPQAPPLPDFASANERLARYASAIRSLAAEFDLPSIDLHRALLERPPPAPWTFDGREWNPPGHRALAAAWMRELGRPAFAEHLASSDLWQRAEIADLLAAVSRKNRLWFDAWRPTNWAFLAGDRTEQQASRDHRDRTIRWFPAEMEEFDPLVAEAEQRIESLASQAGVTP